MLLSQRRPGTSSVPGTAEDHLHLNHSEGLGFFTHEVDATTTRNTSVTDTPNISSTATALINKAAPAVEPAQISQRHDSSVSSTSKNIATTSQTSSRGGLGRDNYVPKHTSVPTKRGGLPRSLTLLGNEKQWTSVHLHFESSQYVPLVLYGPVGCGKSMGASVYFQWHGRKVVGIDGADASGNEELSKWLHRFRTTMTNPPTAILIDDFEGFTEDGRKIIQKTLHEQMKKHPKGPFNPIIITCVQPREPSISKHLSDFKQVRLFPPGQNVCSTWFEHHHVWERVEERDSKLVMVRRCGFPRNLLIHERDTLSEGDLRRCALSLEWSYVMHQRLQGRNGTQNIPNVFDATRMLIHKQLSPFDWASSQAGSDWAVKLLHTNLPRAVHDCDALAEGLETFSFAHTCIPERFELLEQQMHLVLSIDAMATRITSQSRDVGALVPPHRDWTNWGQGAEKCHVPPEDRISILERHHDL
jgi:hypothetical protein